MSFSKTAEFLRYKFTFYKINVYFYKNNIFPKEISFFKRKCKQRKKYR